MQEHGGKQRWKMCGWILEELARRERPMLDERVALAELNKKHRHVHENEEIGDERRGVMLALVGSDRENHGFSSNAG
jgi:hypothetical protein